MVGESMAHAAPGASGASGIWEVALALALVLVVIFAVAWAMRRMVPGAGGANSVLRILAAMPVGPRERLVLVDAAGRQLLLGVTAQQITPLHSFDVPLDLPAAAGSGEFAARLREMLAPAARQ